MPMEQTTFTIETNPASQDLQFLEERINEHNMAVTGYYDFQWLTIFVRDRAQTIIAGISGYTWGLSCKIQFLWVRPDLRGRGYGKALLQAAEAEAARRGCYTVVLDTHSFQAPAFYEKLGYTVAGVYTDFPYQHQQFFLQKRLVQAGSPTNPSNEEYHGDSSANFDSA
jgi:GNAT superfamily N-acetyltransferase